MNPIDYARTLYDVEMIVAAAVQRMGNIGLLVKTRKKADEAFARIVKASQDAIGRCGKCDSGMNLTDDDGKPYVLCSNLGVNCMKADDFCSKWCQVGSWPKEPDNGK